MLNSFDIDDLLDTLADRVADKVTVRLLDSGKSNRKRLFSVAEAGEYLGRSKHAIYQMKAEGKLPAIQDGARILFDKADLDHWIEMHRHNLS